MPTVDSEKESVASEGTPDPVGLFWRLRRFLGSAFESVSFWWVACLVIAGVLALAEWHDINPDGLSYLDRASEAVTHGPGELISTYWSPGYPALIYLALLVFRPSPAHELWLVHALNFIIFVAALAAFTFLLRTWELARPIEQTADGLERKAWTPFAFGCFLWFTMMFVGVGIVSPDLLVIVVAFLLTGLGLKVSTTEAGWKTYVLFGVVLGLGYYVKAVLFPLGLIQLLVVSIYSVRRPLELRRHLFGLGMAFVVFFATCLPLVGAISIRSHGITFGESGGLNYLWEVDGLRPEWVGWTGEDPDFGTPEHAPRTIFQQPTVLEFATPVKGTYPLWYEPSYWYAGARLSWSGNMKRKAANIVQNWPNRIHWFTASTATNSKAWSYMPMVVWRNTALLGVPLFLGLIAMWTLRDGESKGVLRRAPWVLWWCAGGLGMYSIVVVLPRYIAPFLILICLSVYSRVMFGVKPRARAVTCYLVLFWTLTPLLYGTAKEALASIEELREHRQADFEVVGARLHELNLGNGDKVAVVGDAFGSYYAHFGQLQIVAQIPDKAEFLQWQERHEGELENRLRSVGVKAVILAGKDSDFEHGEWIDLGQYQSHRLGIRILGSGH